MLFRSVVFSNHLPNSCTTNASLVCVCNGQFSNSFAYLYSSTFKKEMDIFRDVIYFYFTAEPSVFCLFLFAALLRPTCEIPILSSWKSTAHPNHYISPLSTNHVFDLMIERRVREEREKNIHFCLTRKQEKGATPWPIIYIYSFIFPWKKLCFGRQTTTSCVAQVF